MQGDDSHGLFMLVVLGFLLYLSWPICLWLGLAGLGAWAVHGLRVLAERRVKEKPTHGNRLLSEAGKDLRDGTMCVVIGLAILTGVQILLNVTGWIVSESTVKWWENGLFDAQAGLTGLLSFQQWWKVVTALVLLTILVPKLNAAIFVRDRRKLLQRTWLVLTTISAFTFFSSSAVEGSASWILKRRENAQRNLDRISDARRRLVGASLLDSHIRDMPAGDRPDFVKFVQSHPKLPAPKPDEQAKFEWRVDYVAARFPALPEKIKPAGSADPVVPSAAWNESPFETLLKDVKAWVEWNPAAQQPSQKTLNDCEREAVRMERVLANAEAALVELIKGTVGGVIPLDDAFCKEFVKTAVGSITKRTVGTLFPVGVSNFQRAKEWMKERYGARNWPQVAGNVFHDVPTGPPPPEPVRPPSTFDQAVPRQSPLTTEYVRILREQMERDRTRDPSLRRFFESDPLTRDAVNKYLTDLDPETRMLLGLPSVGKGFGESGWKWDPSVHSPGTYPRPPRTVYEPTYRPPPPAYRPPARRIVVRAGR